MRVAQWNANGLQQRKEEVKLFLKQNLINILFISETHFTNKNHYTIPGYNLCYTCHPDGTAHGGTPDLQDFFITNCISKNYAEVEASYDLTSDHSPIIATLSTSVKNRQPPPKLHTSQTCWETYKNIIRDKVDLKPKLKTRKDIVTATEEFIRTIQQAAQTATPTRAPPRTSTFLPLEHKANGSH